MIDRELFVELLTEWGGGEGKTDLNFNDWIKLSGPIVAVLTGDPDAPLNAALQHAPVKEPDEITGRDEMMALAAFIVGFNIGALYNERRPNDD